MKKEKTKITQELCRKVQIMLAGGAKGKEVAQLLDIGETTVSRIRAAGYDAAQYNANTDRRRIMDKNKEADRKIAEALGQLQGQIRMEMPQAEEQKPEMSEQTKMMRFQAHQADRMIGAQQECVKDLVAVLVRINTNIDRMNDRLGQILRCVGSEKG